VAQGGLNIGDIIFQLLLSVIGIPIVIVGVILIINKRNKRLKRVEEKLDKLIEEKENKNT
jgi:low affinity Fe/Cu permease